MLLNLSTSHPEVIRSESYSKAMSDGQCNTGGHTSVPRNGLPFPLEARTEGLNGEGGDRRVTRHGLTFSQVSPHRFG